MLLATKVTCSQDRLRWLLRNDIHRKPMLAIVPENERSHFWFFITGSLVVFLLTMFLHNWFGRNEGVRALDRQGFVPPPEPKPPDPPGKVRAKRKRSYKRLAAMMLSIVNAPVFVKTGSMSQEVALIAKMKPHRWSPKQAAVIRDAIQAADNETLTNLGAFQGVCDTGCSKFATFDRSDFVPGTYTPSTDPNHVITGIAGGLPIAGEGQVAYEVIDNRGNVKHIQGEAILIAELPIRLIPPQKVMRSDRDGCYQITGEGGKFVFAHDKSVVPTHLDLTTDLPMLTLFHNVHAVVSSLETSLYSCVANESNQNLTPTQKETLRWHWRLGHPGKDVLHWLATRGLLGPNSPRLAKQDIPMCATCNYGKQTRTPTGTTRTEVRSSRGGGIQDNKLEPGDEVAADQFETRQRGRRFNTGGKEKDVDKFAGGTVFSDVATGYTRVYFQVSLGAAETLQSKLHFERTCLAQGVVVQRYRTDNGIFTKEEFMEAISQAGQGLTVSGVGAHHQNGIAERSIRTVVTKARMMLLHAQLRWPEQTSVDLWPMAMQHASFLNNVIPKIRDGLSPEEKFSRSLKAADRLHKLPVWGCPAYVLQPTLQDAKKLPKWQPRSRRSQYVGWSPMHASNVALVRNLTTGRISPQFHVVFDNWFETTSADEDIPPPEWDILITTSLFEANVDAEDLLGYDLDDEWLSKEELIERRREQEKSKSRMRPPGHRKTRQQQDSSSENRETSSSQDVELPDVSDATPEPVPSPSLDSVNRSKPSLVDLTRDTETPAISSPETMPPTDLSSSGPVRRSQRQRSRPQRYGYDGTGLGGYLNLMEHVRQTPLSKRPTVAATVAYWTLLAMDPNTGELDTFEPVYTAMAFKASKKKRGQDPDSPTYEQAMTGEHREQFVEAMTKEIRELEKKDTWNAVEASTVPDDAQIVPLTWVFRIKRLPNGLFSKFKARLCVRGDLQDEHRETYAPVVRWTTIRSVLAFAVKNNLKTRQIDFMNAFVQSTLPEDERIFVKLPKGFSHQGVETVLRLNKSLYGMLRSPLHWFNSLKTSLLELGYEQSKNDQCMFINKKTHAIVLVYVDDCLCFGPDDKVLDELIASLRKKHELGEEEVSKDVYAYLGIELNMEGDFVEMRQIGLIEKALKAVNMMEATPNETPAKEEPLGPDYDGEPFQEEWEYPSVVGMLMYLVNTRPDIQFAVHQCAKYTHAPRKCHANAVKKICRYLQGTKHKGLRFSKSRRNDDSFHVDCFVDASFAPMWGVESDEDPSSAKSRTGYVIRIDDVPVAWASMSQGDTAMSTTEAEYIALSQAMRELIWIRRLVVEITEGLGVEYDKVSKVKSKVFEDNQGTIALAKKPNMTSRTRHIHTKYHHFKEHLGVEDGDGIEIEYIETENQVADIFTKGVGNTLYKPLRDKLMGWVDYKLAGE